MEPTGLKIIVGTPAYNEAKYIGSIVLQARQYAREVIVVDDGSIDQTLRVAQLAGATVIRHNENRGYGAAIRSIFKEAMKSEADILVILDADSQHNPDEIPILVEAVSNGSDIVIGTRKMQRKVIPFYRRIGQTVLSNLVRVLSRNKGFDTESGFRAISKEALAVLDLKETGFAACSEMISIASRKGLKVTEVPISVTYSKDSSTMNPIKHGLGVLQRIMVMISERRPLLFFGLIGSMCVIAGTALAVLVVRIFYDNQVLATGYALMSMLFVTIGILLISTGLILSVLVKRIGDR